MAGRYGFDWVIKNILHYNICMDDVIVTKRQVWDGDGKFIFASIENASTITLAKLQFISTSFKNTKMVMTLEQKN